MPDRLCTFNTFAVTYNELRVGTPSVPTENPLFFTEIGLGYLLLGGIHKAVFWMICLVLIHLSPVTMSLSTLLQCALTG